MTDALRFAKYHGTGNDFVMIEDMDDRIRLTPALVAALCDRHLGVGADGVIRIAPAEEAEFFMDYWNADGGVAEMCGNGVRCLAKYVFDRGLTHNTMLDVDTRAGRKRLELDTDGGRVRSVQVDMGSPALRRGDIPMAGDPGQAFVGEPFAVEGRTFTATAVSMGNPHLVLEGTEDLEALDLHRLGPPLERHPDFPEGTNVEFIRARDGVVEVRVWERGSGATMACGTGACASVVAASLRGLVPRRATARFPGGDLEVEWTEGGPVTLTGPATFVFDGDLAPEWMEAVERSGAAASGGGRP